MVEFRKGDKITLRHPFYDSVTIEQYGTFTVHCIIENGRYVETTHDAGRGTYTFELGQIELYKRARKITINTRKNY